MITEAIGKEKNQQQNFTSKNCVGNKEIKNLKVLQSTSTHFSLRLDPSLLKSSTLPQSLVETI